MIEKLREIVDLLDGINYAFFSGMAMEIYTNGKRKAGDVDVLISNEDIERFAKIIGCRLGRRKIDKEGYKSEDYGGIVDYNGQEVELTSGFPPERMKGLTIRKLFDKKVKMKYLGLDVFVVPVEETVVFKALMHRKKDIIDLKLLKGMKFDNNLVKEFARDWGQEEKAIRILREIGFEV
jgi:predicted nucleotidyltransferase